MMVAKETPKHLDDNVCYRKFRQRAFVCSLHKYKNKLLVEHQVTFDTFRTAYLGEAVLPFTVDAQ
jgi:hypothetical protein